MHYAAVCRCRSQRIVLFCAEANRLCASVANELGAQQPKQARSAALTAVTLTAFCTSILGLLLLGFRYTQSVVRA